MRLDTFEYKDGGTVCEGAIALPSGGGKHPAVLIVHQWAGITAHEHGAAERLAREGYAAIAVDVYGKGVRGQVGGDNTHIMKPYLDDRAKLRQRLLSAVAAAKAHPSVDASRIAVIGYCFGGLCAIDVARSGTSDVNGVVSLHGIFAPPGLGAQPKINAKVLVLHGWDDPLAPPKDVLALANELTEAKADWQIHGYGHTVHAFTAPGREGYSESADRRSWASTLAFLKEVFA